jgi:hypothetical protein
MAGETVVRPRFGGGKVEHSEVILARLRQFGKTRRAAEKP